MAFDSLSLTLYSYSLSLFATSSKGSSCFPIWRRRIGKREDPGDEIALLFNFHFPILHIFQFERAVALQFCVGLSQNSRSLVIAHSQAVTTSRSNIYVFNKRLPTTCSVGGLESFQNKLQGYCFHFYQICECKNFLELDFLWAFCQQCLTLKVS